MIKLSILLGKVGPDICYITTLKLPLLLFWGHDHKHDLRDATDSFPPLLSRLSLFFASIVLILFNLDSIFSVFFSVQNFPHRDSLKKSLILRICLAESWEVGPRWWRTRAKQASSWQEPHSICGGRARKVHIPCGDRQPSRVADPCSRGSGQTGKNVPMCTGWLRASGRPSPHLFLSLELSSLFLFTEKKRLVRGLFCYTQNMPQMDMSLKSVGHSSFI